MQQNDDLRDGQLSDLDGVCTPASNQSSAGRQSEPGTKKWNGGTRRRIASDGGEPFGAAIAKQSNALSVPPPLVPDATAETQAAAAASPAPLSPRGTIDQLNRHVSRSTKMVTYVSLRGLGLVAFDPSLLVSMEQLAFVDLSHNQLETAPIFVHHAAQLLRKNASALTAIATPSASATSAGAAAAQSISIQRDEVTSSELLSPIRAVNTAPHHPATPNLSPVRDMSSSSMDSRPFSPAAAVARAALERRWAYNPAPNTKAGVPRGRNGTDPGVDENAPRVFPSLWHIDLSHNRIRSLPHLAVTMPMIGHLYVDGNPLTPPEVVAAFRGLVAAEVRVPNDVSREALVDTMLGVMAINGQLAPLPSHANAKKGELNRHYLRRRYRTWPFDAILSTLHARDNHITASNTTATPEDARRAAERELLSRLFVTSFHAASASIESTERFAFSFGKVPTDLSCDEEPVSLPCWESLRENVAAFELVEHSFAAVRHGLLPQQRLPTILAQCIRDHASNLSERDKAKFLRLARLIPTWPIFVVEHLAALLQLRILRADEVDFILIRDQLDDRDDGEDEGSDDGDKNSRRNVGDDGSDAAQLVDVLRHAEVQAQRARAEAAERARHIAEETRNATSFRESMNLKRRLFTQMREHRVATPTLLRAVSRSLNNSTFTCEILAEVLHESAASVISQPASPLSPPDDAKSDTALPAEECFQFLPDHPSTFIARHQAKQRIDRARTPGYGVNPRRQPAHCFPDKATIAPTSVQVGESLMLIDGGGKAPPKKLRGVKLVVADPGVAGGGDSSFVVRTPAKDGSAAALMQCQTLTLSTQRLHEWDPVDSVWRYKWAAEDATINEEALKQRRRKEGAQWSDGSRSSGQRGQTQGSAALDANLSMDVLEFLKRRGQLREKSSHAISMLEDALAEPSAAVEPSSGAANGVASTPHQSSPAVPPRVVVVVDPGAAASGAPRWTKHEEQRISTMMASNAFTAAEILNYAANALKTVRADGEAYRVLQSAAWVFAEELGVAFSESLENATMCIDAAIATRNGERSLPLSRPPSAAQPLGMLYSSAGRPPSGSSAHRPGSAASASVAAAVGVGSKSQLGQSLSRPGSSSSAMSFTARSGAQVGAGGGGGGGGDSDDTTPVAEDIAAGGGSEGELRTHSASSSRRPPSASLLKVRAQSASLQELRRVQQQQHHRRPGSAAAVATDRSHSPSSPSSPPSLGADVGGGTHQQHHPFVQAAVDSMARTRYKAEVVRKAQPVDATEKPRRTACSATLRPLRTVVESSRPQFLPAAVRQHVGEKRRPGTAPLNLLGPIVFTDA